MSFAGLEFAEVLSPAAARAVRLDSEEDDVIDALTKLQELEDRSESVGGEGLGTVRGLYEDHTPGEELGHVGVWIRNRIQLLAAQSARRKEL